MNSDDNPKGENPSSKPDSTPQQGQNPKPKADRPAETVIASRTESSPALKRYWRWNIIVMSILLVIWAAAGIGCGILFADVLNEYRLFNTGYPLGFWFAQQGSIIVFVLTILAYCLIMNQLDAKHKVEREEELAARGGSQTEGGAA